MLRIIFVLLQRKLPYQDDSVDYEKMIVQRNAPRWIKQLEKYNLLTT